MSARRFASLAVTAVAALLAVLAGPLVQPAGATTDVSNVSWKATSTAAGATQITYTVGFTATTTLGASPTITLTGPTGTVFPTSSAGGCYTVAVNGTAGTTCGETVSSAPSPSVTLPAPAINGGDAVVVTVDGVTNGSSTGAQPLYVSTSADATPVASTALTFTPATALGDVALTASSTSANASAVTYRLSATLTNGITAGHSTFTFTYPSSVSINGTSGCNGYFHVSVNGGPETFCGSTLAGLTSGDPRTISFRSPVSAAAGATIVASIDGASNGSTSSTQSMAVATSSDQTAVSTAVGYTPATSVGAASASLSSTTPNATGVVLTAGFTATNGLTPSTATEQLSTISLFLGSAQLPASAGCGGAYAVSVNGGPAATCGVAITSSGSGNVSFTTPTTVHAGDHVTVVITGVTNGSYVPATMSIATTSDPTSVNAPVTVTPSAAPPTVTQVSPAAGASSGSTPVTITGTGFGDASAVHFGTAPALSFVATSATSISAKAPAGTPGSVHVTVTNSRGTSAPSAADTFTYVGPPTITSLSPNTGPKAGGTTVTIHGAGLAGVQQVVLGETPIAFTHVDDSTLTFVTRPGHDLSSVQVSSPCAYGTLPAGATSCGPSNSLPFYYPATPKKLVRMVLKVTGGLTYKLDSTALRDSLQQRYNAKHALTYLTASFAMAGHTPPYYYTTQVGFYLHVYKGKWVGSFQVIDQTHDRDLSFHELKPVVVHANGTISGVAVGTYKVNGVKKKITVAWTLYPKWQG